MMKNNIIAKEHSIAKVLRNLTVLCLIVTSVMEAQNGPIDFDNVGADWTWTTFENNSNPELEIVANPDPSGINTSGLVAKFTALSSGQPFAGVESLHGSDIGTFSLDAENAIVKIKVYKTVISDVGIKFATPAGASTGEIKVPNTVTNEWEELTFDFTGVINEPSSMGIDQIIVFPDFRDRDADAIVYFDEILFGNQTLGFETESVNNQVSMFPNPVKDNLTITSNNIITSLNAYDLTGKMVYETEGNTNLLNVDVSNFTPGVYFLTIQSGNTIQQKKFIKQ